jgi:hypothetical protein
MSACVGSIEPGRVLLSLGMGEGMTLAEVHLSPDEAAELARRLVKMVVYLLGEQKQRSPDPQPMQLMDTHE